MFNVNFPEWDTDLFIFLNGKNLPWLDQIMVLLSSYTVWGIVFLLVAGVMMYRNRTEGKRAAIFLFLGVCMTLLLNNLVKLLFMRPRPGSEDILKDLINQLEEIGRSSSFFLLIHRVQPVWQPLLPFISKTNCIVLLFIVGLSLLPTAVFM